MMKKHYSHYLNSLMPICEALEVISGKSKLRVIISIGVGSGGFSTIPKSIPGLAKTLNDLEQHKLIKRAARVGYPAIILDTLELPADTLPSVLDTLKEWGILHRLTEFHQNKIN